MSDVASRKLLEATNEVTRRPDMPEPEMSTGGIVDKAIDALSEWIGQDVTPDQIRAVLWGAAMESKNSDVVQDAITAIYDEHAREMEADMPPEDREQPEGGVPEATEEPVTEEAEEAPADAEEKEQE